MDELKRCPFCGGKLEIIYDGYFYEPYCETAGCVLNQSFNTEEEAIKAVNRRVNGWISVDERLPEEYKDVEITDGKNVEIGMYVDVPYPLGNIHEWETDKIEHSEINLKKITHWKEKPQPPKGV